MVRHMPSPASLPQKMTPQAPTPSSLQPLWCVVGAITWEIVFAIWRAQLTQPVPGNGPPGSLFVPDSVHSQVLQSAHCSQFAAVLAPIGPVEVTFLVADDGRRHPGLCHCLHPMHPKLGLSPLAGPVFCDPCLFPATPGHTLPWILSPVYPLPK